MNWDKIVNWGLFALIMIMGLVIGMSWISSLEFY